MSLLKIPFDIDVNSGLFQGLIRDMDLVRPAERVTPVTWSLKKIIILLESEPFTGPNISDNDLLAKSVFLLMFTSGGRISELVSLQRGKRFLVKVRSGECFTLSP